MAWVLVGLQMEENSMTEKEMIEAWVKKNKPKRYQHGERPEGQEPPTISAWGRPKKVSKAEQQAAKDSEKE
jgi:hypothetical protein